MWRVTLVFLGLFLGACAKSSSSVPLARSSELTDSPFTLNLLTESRDEFALYLAGNVTARSPWDPTTVAVQVRVLAKDGEVQRVARLLSDFSVSKEPTALVRSGEEIPFSFVLPIQDFSTYLVELTWGDDAMVVATPNLRAEVVGLTTAPVPCGAPPCPVYPVAKVALQRIGGSGRVDRVKLTLSAPWLDRLVKVKVNGGGELGNVVRDVQIPVPFFPEDVPSAWGGTVVVDSVNLDE